MQRTQYKGNQELVLLELEEEFTIPTNCWAFVEELDGRRRLVQETVVRGSQIPRIILAPKVAGG